MSKSDDALKKAIDELNLDPIKIKIMDKEEGLGWTANQVDEAEKFYKRFLFLSAKYPKQPLVPTKHIDAFWHWHILDTQKYSADCISVFGVFLHHFPYFGKRGNDTKVWQNSISETDNLNEQHFRESAHKLDELFKDSGDNVYPNCFTPGCAACGSTDRVPQPQLRPSLPNNALNTSHAWF